MIRIIENKHISCPYTRRVYLNLKSGVLKLKTLSQLKLVQLLEHVECLFFLLLSRLPTE